MSLIAEAEEFAYRQGGKCSIQTLREALDAEGQKELDEAMAAPIPGTALAKALQKRGHKIGHDAIQRHRRGSCQCR